MSFKTPFHESVFQKHGYLVANSIINLTALSEATKVTGLPEGSLWVTNAQGTVVAPFEHIGRQIHTVAEWAEGFQDPLTMVNASSRVIELPSGSRYVVIRPIGGDAGLRAIIAADESNFEDTLLNILCVVGLIICIQPYIVSASYLVYHMLRERVRRRRRLEKARREAIVKAGGQPGFAEPMMP